MLGNRDLKESMPIKSIIYLLASFCCNIQKSPVASNLQHTTKKEKNYFEIEIFQTSHQH